jgi:hypothetical protein
MTVPRLILAALLTAAGLVLLTPASAQACSCVGGDVATYAERADVVFTGTLVEITPPPKRLFWSSGDPATYSFDVDRVHQGEVGRSAEVRSAVSGASCGLEGMQTGSRYVVFATLADGLWANLCGGTGPVRPGVVRQLENAVGPARAPAVDFADGSDHAVGSVGADGADGPPGQPGLPGLLGPGVAGAVGLLVIVAGVLPCVSSSGSGSTPPGGRRGGVRTPAGSWVRRRRARSARGSGPTGPRR